MKRALHFMRKLLVGHHRLKRDQIIAVVVVQLQREARIDVGHTSAKDGEARRKLVESNEAIIVDTGRTLRHAEYVQDFATLNLVLLCVLRIGEQLLEAGVE